MDILHIIVAWLFFMALYMLWQKFREDRAHGRSFFNFGDFNFLIGAITALIAAWGVFTFFSPEPRFKNDEEKIAFAERTKQPWLVTQVMWDKIAEDSLNPDYHFQLLQNHFTQQEETNAPPDVHAYDQEGRRIFNYYTDLSEKENDPALNDIGYLFLATYYIEREGHDADLAMFNLRQVNNKKLKYVNYTAGKILLYDIGPEAAEPHFLDELHNGGYKKGAYEGLAIVYDLTGRFDELKKLCYDPESRASVPEELRYKVYFLHGDLISFYQLRFSKMFGTLPLWGILGSLFILLTWLFFLKKLSFLSPVRWRHFFLAVGIGALLAMFSWLLYEFYHHVLHFWTNGHPGNDFLFSFLGIGCIEELVKLIPFLILLHFTKIIKKPVDYLLVASAAGLGFAFFENMLYISQYGLEVIHSRALTASVSHMVSSAIVAYGYVLVRFRYPAHKWIIPAFFVLAALAHGFYDFWLLNGKVHSLAIVTLVFFLSETLVYVSFLNNALNQSVDANHKPSDLTLNTQRLASFLAGALICVFTLEYIGTCWIYGTKIGNRDLMSAFLSGGFLIFFLSVRLSNIDILPGEWSRIEFFRGLLPSEVLGGTRRMNFNSVVGISLIFMPDLASGSLSMQLPVTGTVRRRLTVKGFTGWFEVELEKPVYYGITGTSRVFIRAKNEYELIRQGTPVTIGVFVQTQMNGQSHLVFFDWANVQ